MNNTIQSLQELYVKMGGSLTDTYATIASEIPVSDYTVIPDMIEALSQIASSGSGLPEVTSEDNGKILGVVNGQWDKEDIPMPDTSKIPLVINIVEHWVDGSIQYFEEDGRYFNDIMSAMNESKPIQVKLKSYSADTEPRLEYIVDLSSNTYYPEGTVGGGDPEFLCEGSVINSGGIRYNVSLQQSPDGLIDVIAGRN